jgi:pyruvate dehydrogenase (quinone)
MAEARVVPDDDALRRTADLLNAGQKVAMLVGQGARGCAAELTEVADLLGAGAAKALLGKDVLPDDLPWVTGSIGLLGTTASWHLMMDCDTLLTVGSNFPYTQFMPKLDQARAVQIDRSGKWIGMRYPYEINLVGDAKSTLRALIPLLERKTDRTWLEKIEKWVDSWWTTVQRTAMTDADPLNPMRIFWELSERMPENAIIAADSGSSANWYARHLKFRGDVRGSLSGTLATMGPGVPYVIGAKWAHPDRPSIAFVGDGAMQMNGMAELITISKYYKQWADPRLIVAVLHNNDLNQVTWEMRAMENSPKFEASQSLPDVDFAGFARSLGLHGDNIDDAAALGDAWDRALAADRPTVLDVRCDPNVPPIPPHATFDQAKSLVEAVVGGDEDSAGFIKQGVKQKVQQYFSSEKKER